MPYNEDWDSEEIDERTLHGKRPELPRHVALIDDPILVELISLMDGCWKTDPSKRPTSLEVLATLKRIRQKQDSQSINTILIGVTASRKTFPTRVKVVEQTWARNPPANVVIRYLVGDATNQNYLSGSSEDIYSLAKQAGVTDVSRIVVMRGVVDDEYPLVTKASQVLKRLEQIVQESEHTVDWIMDVDDDTFVYMDGMVKFLAARDSQRYQYIGRRAYGVQDDKESLRQAGLVKPYCNGGPGFALSRPTLKVLAKSIDSCQQRVQANVADPKRVYDDVLVGICVYNETGIGCWTGSNYIKDRFYRIFSEEPNDEEILHGVTSHAFKNPRQMLDMNRRYLSLLPKQVMEDSDTIDRRNVDVERRDEGNEISYHRTRKISNSSLVSPIAIFGRVQAYVTTLANILDEHKGRLKVFRENWKEIPLQYQVNDAVLLEADGLGCSQSLLNAVEKAMNNATKEFYLFLEDDAAPFASMSRIKFAQQFTHTLAEWPQESPYLLLGGCFVCHLEDPNQGLDGLGGVTKIQVAMGSYAILIRRSFLKEFHGLLQRHINERRSHYSPDAFLFRSSYFNDSQPAYIATPLLVDHVPGHSASLGFYRADPWMGNPRWWETKLSESRCSRGTYQVPGCDVACGRSSVHKNDERK